MPRYAPAREDGLKPYVVTVTSWGRSHDTLTYAESARDAVWRTVGRQRYTYGKARRATPEDIAEREQEAGR
ncbi:MAG TPA: hypothetical protein VFT50_11560 [Baekduia sp.]|nr:hypothetical protein [Baekduia sp.]